MPAIYYIYWLIHGEEPDWLPRRKLSWKEGYQLGLEKAARQQRWNGNGSAMPMTGLESMRAACDAFPALRKSWISSRPEN
jgi:hypothetical protein